MYLSLSLVLFSLSLSFCACFTSICRATELICVYVCVCVCVCPLLDAGWGQERFGFGISKPAVGGRYMHLSRGCNAIYSGASRHRPAPGWPRPAALGKPPTSNLDKMIRGGAETAEQQRTARLKRSGLAGESPTTPCTPSTQTPNTAPDLPLSFVRTLFPSPARPGKTCNRGRASPR